MIRFLEKNDTEKCIEMLTEFYETDAVVHNIPKEYIQNTIDVALSDSPYLKILIYEIEKHYAGFCTLSFTHSTEAGGLVLLIEEIYIRDTFKGQGIGTAFFHFIRNMYDDTVKRYRLEVDFGNQAAIRLYERLGFKTLPYAQMVIDL